MLFFILMTYEEPPHKIYSGDLNIMFNKLKLRKDFVPYIQFIEILGHIISTN